MQTLARILFFKDAADTDLSRFDRSCTWRRFEPNEIAVDYEDEGADVFFIISGEVRVLIRAPNGKEVILGEMKGGSYFGELAALDGTPRSANVTALTRCEMCIMPPKVFRDILFTSPAIADKVFKLLVTRIRELNARVNESAVLDLKYRLYSELLRLSSPRPGAEKERIVSPPPFHHVLAARIGCRREQVTRELSALAKDGLVTKTRGALVLTQPEVLKSRIDRALQQGG